MREDKFYKFKGSNNLGLINPLNPESTVNDYYELYQGIQSNMNCDCKKYVYKVDIKFTDKIDQDLINELGGYADPFQLSYYTGSPLEPYSSDIIYQFESPDTLSGTFYFLKKLTPAEEIYLGKLVEFEMLQRFGRNLLYKIHDYYEEELGEDGDHIDFDPSNNWKVTRKWTEGSGEPDLSWMDDAELPPMKKI